MHLYKICFFVPDDHKEKVKTAMFSAGAGKIGNYDACSFETSGTGQFRALPGSQPFLGEQNKIEKVSEYKVEMVCDGKFISDVISALKKSHPYETPAYEVFKMEEF